MSTRGFSQFRNKLKRTERTLNREKRQMPRRIGSFGKKELRARILLQDLYVTTELWRSTKYRAFAAGDASVVKISVDAPYAGYVDKGTGKFGPYPAPDNVPLNEIMEWMRLKPDFRGEATLPKAFTIIENIKEYGTEAQPYWDDSWDATERYAKQQFRDALDNAF